MAEKGRTVLVVDDDPAILEVVLALVDHLGYEAVGVDCGLEAFILIKESPERFHLLLTDWQMKELDGMDLARLVSLSRYVRGEPRIPMVLMTGREVTEEMLADAGFCASLKKPFTVEELEGVLDTAFGVRAPVSIAANVYDAAGRGQD